MGTSSLVPDTKESSSAKRIESEYRFSTDSRTLMDGICKPCAFERQGLGWGQAQRRRLPMRQSQDGDHRGGTHLANSINRPPRQPLAGGVEAVHLQEKLPCLLSATPRMEIKYHSRPVPGVRLLGSHLILGA